MINGTLKKQSNPIEYLMRILLDPQIFDQQTYGGISRYYTEVFSVLSKRNDIEVILPIYSSDNAYVTETDLMVKNKSLYLLYGVLAFFKISTRTLRRKNSEKLLNQTFENKNYDVFVPTYYNPYFLDKIGDKPFVLTVYDMIHEILPEYFIDDHFKVVERKLLLMEKAAKIIAVSHNTKKDITKIYPHIDPAKIEVVHHGSSIKIHPDVKVNLPENYILYVGSRADYKNFQFFLRAAVPLLKQNHDLMIIAAGGGKFKEEEVELLKELGVEKQVLQRKFDEKELGHFYQKAKCFVFPSLYEGFGIPVLESMACGCPIILTRHGSFPEVAGDAGIYFDSDSEEDLRTKIEMLLFDEDVRKQYAQKGLEHVKKFDWKDAAEQCLKVYSDAVKQ
ncbi:Glycosyltransferase involved in cell wall bisynthesis [Chryseobacterium taihuense]|uniref:Glycosyltransferase involved in cell wall bisynthesis n=2 Tax=Chryseobacterium taihuense TaxID=1141221 RepID=A0ABY0QUZ1_9FLAO|nr:Glycosyltransferase involved in cell wall bisynthesis [Chryseobacterium taihuense]